MLHLKSLITIALLWLSCATTANGAEIPAPQDIRYPGTLTLSVDLTDLDRRLFMVRESVPVKAGPLTLLYPQWLPGTHGPNGPVNLLTGLIITARGRRLPWLRDPVNMYAFHIDVPADADHVDLEFQFASPQTTEQGRIVATPEILGLQWNTVVLETDAAEVLGERQQKVVTIERARAVERVRFFHQFAVGRELLWIDFELRRMVRNQIGVHRHVGAGIEINALVVPAGE